MSAKDLSKLPKTDWDRVDALADAADIDTSEGLLDEDFFGRAELHSPEPRTAVTLGIDSSVLA